MKFSHTSMCSPFCWYVRIEGKEVRMRGVGIIIDPNENYLTRYLRFVVFTERFLKDFLIFILFKTFCELVSLT